MSIKKDGGNTFSSGRRRMTVLVSGEGSNNEKKNGPGIYFLRLYGTVVYIVHQVILGERMKSFSYRTNPTVPEVRTSWVSTSLPFVSEKVVL